ncbi:MAG: hypothetical protein EZS28_008308 [Streblomastix strix]|uniref:Uncharacterized protein n=1 Tax=Streblomastix strix TaxID=222440 RepID=A0A5J4WMF4_9EUKA|nr:MAG: hypothetical protein EZS28_008308 [Streblomastix strix]
MPSTDPMLQRYCWTYIKIQNWLKSDLHSSIMHFPRCSSQFPRIIFNMRNFRPIHFSQSNCGVAANPIIFFLGIPNAQNNLAIAVPQFDWFASVVFSACRCEMEFEILVSGSYSFKRSSLVILFCSKFSSNNHNLCLYLHHIVFHPQITF